MSSATNQKISDYIKTRRSTLIDAVYLELERCNLSNQLPEHEDVMEARNKPLSEEAIAKFFPPPKHKDQTEASYEEQKHLMAEFHASVNQYLSSCHTHRNIVTVGGPGVGKATVAMICTL
jgi:DNA replication protein DnaC